MKRFPILGTLLLIPAFALMVAVGCDKGSKTPATKSGDGGAKVEPKGELKPITTATEGVLEGVVTFKGTPPTPKEDTAMAKHGEAAKCEAGGKVNPHFVQNQLWFVNKDGGVANVVISLEPPKGMKFEIDKKISEPYKKKTVVIDQPYCAYNPHVVALYAPYEKLVVKNSGKMTHNTMIKTPSNKSNNIDINKGIGPGETWPPLEFEYEAKPFNIGCGAHQFMTGKMLLFNNPYFAVTKDDGTFKISHLPIDQELDIYMWHESMDKAKDVQKITLKKGDNNVKLSISN